MNRVLDTIYILLTIILQTYNLVYVMSINITVPYLLGHPPWSDWCLPLHIDTQTRALIHFITFSIAFASL